MQRNSRTVMLSIFVGLLDDYVRLYRIYIDNLLSTDDFFKNSPFFF